MEAINYDLTLKGICDFYESSPNNYREIKFEDDNIYDNFEKIPNDSSDPPTAGAAMIHPEFNYDNEEFEENALW